MRWFRRHAPRIAAAAILSLTALGASTLSPHEDDCHDSCFIFVEHDPAAHRVGVPTAADEGHTPHCLVCHWARSLRHRIEARILPAPATNAGLVVHLEVFTSAAAALTAQPPLRSPPRHPIA